MTDLFAGQLPEHPSPRLVKRRAKHARVIQRSLLAGDLSRLWPDDQRHNLSMYLRYLRKVAFNMRNLRTLQLLDQLAVTLRALDAAVDAENAAPDSHDTAEARRLLAAEIEQSRHMLGAVLPYLYGNAQLAQLLEPVYYLLLAPPRVLWFFTEKTQLYRVLRKKYPLFWGNSNGTPRWYTGLGIESLSVFWQEIAPLTADQLEAAYRTPVVRASFRVAEAKRFKRALAQAYPQPGARRAA
jgi:hypothetical protein